MIVVLWLIRLIGDDRIMIIFLLTNPSVSYGTSWWCWKGSWLGSLEGTTIVISMPDLESHRGLCSHTVLGRWTRARISLKTIDDLDLPQWGPKWAKRYLLSNDCLHGCSIFGSCVVSVELVGNWSVVLSVLLNGLLHETGERGEDVDGWIDLLVVQLPIYEDLSLSDVACQVRNGVSDIIILSWDRFTGIERMGIWVIEPFRPCTLPARS